MVSHIWVYTKEHVTVRKNSGVQKVTARFEASAPKLWCPIKLGPQKMATLLENFPKPPDVSWASQALPIPGRTTHPDTCQTIDPFQWAMKSKQNTF